MTACLGYRPDHNGECLNCDEPFEAHTAVTLAQTFVQHLRDALSAEDYREMRRRNRNAAPGICHSHDFLDANVVMAQAFRDNGLDPDVSNDDVVALWNEAWEVAMRVMAIDDGGI